MYSGNNTIKVDPNSKLVIKASAVFTCYGMIDKNEVEILGSFGGLRISTPLKPEITHVKIQTAKNTKYTVEFIPMASRTEQLDTTPIEVPIQRPLTLKEEMQRFIRQEFSNQLHDDGFETFEESDDFDIDDDFDPLSEYELSDLQEEFIAETPPEPSQDPQEPIPDKSGGEGGDPPSDTPEGETDPPKE